MDYCNYEAVARFENGFWLQILSDYAQFSLDYLPSTEQEDVYTSKYFISVYSKLLEKAREIPQSTKQVELSNMAFKYATESKNFALSLLRKSLIGKTQIMLTPTLLNHIVNEIDMYLFILKYLRFGQIPPIFHPLEYHKFWLLDAIGHADMIRLGLDEVEKKLIQNTEEFRKRFLELYEKALELCGYTRTNLLQFPALRALNKEVEHVIKDFMEFLEELEEKKRNHEILATFSFLVPEHMLREECYYLTKLAQVSEIKKPDCSPIRSY
ncbi:MAG: DUF2935 domain-containing protein [Bacillota bacterium]